MNIIVERKKVFDRVCSEVFLRGEVKKDEKADVAAMAQMSADDKDVFDDLFAEASKEVLGVLSIWSNPRLALSDEGATFRVCPPPSWSQMVEELTLAVEVFIVHKVVNRWMYILGIGAEDFSATDAFEVKRILTKREKPL